MTKVLIENVLPSQTLTVLGEDELKAINEAIDTELVKHKKLIEKDTAVKFESMVDSIHTKFSSQVESAITESVKSHVVDDVSNKMISTITDVINILESSGIYTTERSKELTDKLKKANEDLREAYTTRNAIKEQLDNEQKVNYILQRLVGMNPKVVSSALEYFKDKDILDVQDEIDAFIDGDFDSLLQDTNEMNDGLDDLTLDQVSDVLNQVADQDKLKKSKSKFEAIGKGLEPIRATGVNRAPTVDLNALVETSMGGKSNEQGEDEDDTQIAMNQIENFRDLGYRFH